ncbi:zinc finger CCCH domain-containing protein 48-like [Gastrolobium bilobum]|uniref:zinc finger CCCH domain-containing protein 48-like n=1 Tax=Gastrolobium bilobum TaxID=150636 RepID=UPI002AB31169|nr:zinc finger CCCH domain-containing protein 48-like [Gastrolobium bilobum]
MDMKVARRTERTVGTTCAYWLAGRCNRNPCRFLHGETPVPVPSAPYYKAKNAYCYMKPNSSYEKIPRYKSRRVYVRNNDDGGDGTNVTVASQSKSPSQSICRYWMKDNCAHGDQCQNLHSWFYGDRLSKVANLQEHEKVVTGIALPVGSDKLYSGSVDGTVRMWDCHSGRCADVINLGVEITSFISESPWVFVGVRSAVRAWNIQTASEFTLNGPKGQVLAMIVGNDTLFAGAEDGVISAWRGSSEAISPFELIKSPSGHTKAVVCLTVGRNKLYSGSMDHSIMVWNLDTLECKMTLNGHTDIVTSLICWHNYLLSSSYDCTIKVWTATEEGTFEVTYTHSEENGVLALSGMTDAEDKNILFCSCRDNSVHLYELPSFSEMGRIFAEKEVQSLEIGPGGLFFTGDTVC